MCIATSVTISNVTTPTSIQLNESFNISWEEKYYIRPLKKCKIISRVYKSGVLLSDSSYVVRQWKWWGSKIHIVSDCITAETTYKIEVGYDEVNL